MKHISSVSGGFKDHQQNGSDENQHRKLIEPAVKNMAVTICIITKPFYQVATPQVVDDQDKHQNKFGREPETCQRLYRTPAIATVQKGSLITPPGVMMPKYSLRSMILNWGLRCQIVGPWRGRQKVGAGRKGPRTR